MIYLASPYTHPDPAVRKARLDEVSRIAGYFICQGNVLFCPISQSAAIAEVCDLPYQFDFWEAFDTHVILRCSEVWVVMMEGWETSKGVQAEIKIAKDLRKPISFITPTMIEELLQCQRQQQPRSTPNQPQDNSGPSSTTDDGRSGSTVTPSQISPNVKPTSS